MSSLTPEKATIGQSISWLVWTDPSLSGQAVTLTITDVNNSTVLQGYPRNINLGTSNGSRIVTVTTAGYKTHEYRFKANTTTGNMKLVSTRYQDFEGRLYSVYASASPYHAIPGETVDLTLVEYPSVDAVANITFGNLTYTKNVWPNVVIPASNGSRTIKGISTSGLKPGNYEFKVNATSSLGKDTASGILVLSDIIVEAEKYSYLLGDQVNITIRTYPTITKAGLSIFFANYTAFPPTIKTVVDQNVTLSNGRTTRQYSSASWPVGRRARALYNALANASVSGETVDAVAFFNLDVFDVEVETNKNEYLAGQSVQVTTSTDPTQAGATLTLRISNSSDLVRTIGPITLLADGTSVNQIDTTGWPVEDYEIEASVVNTNHYMRNNTASFKVIKRTFNIYATLDASSYTDFMMPALTITTTPGQTNANLTITVDGLEGEYYTFTKNGFDSTTYLYGVPLLKQPNGTDIIEVKITSPAGTNDTTAILQYTHSPNMSVIPESFLLETLLLIGSSPVVYYAVRKRRKTS
jgi:hypothetical protein